MSATDPSVSNSYIPHLVVILGAVICGLIYALALVITMLSPPLPHHGHGSLLETLRTAHTNLQANGHLANIRISWQDEFFVTLLKTGFKILWAATEAVYFNEDTNVTVAPRTWLEEKKFNDVSKALATSRRIQATIPTELRGDLSRADRIGLIEEDQILSADGMHLLSGFARERKTTKHATNTQPAASKEEGVGVALRNGRWLHTIQFMRGVIGVCATSLARVEITLLQSVGLRAPDWLVNLTRHNSRSETSQTDSQEQPKFLEFWMLSDEGELSLPVDANVDVEIETRRRLQNSESSNDHSEQAIDSNLYGWWKNGGWWGELDSSGAYDPGPQDDDEDTTSIISRSNASASVSGNESDSDDEDGRRTPTQKDPQPASRGATPLEDNFLIKLAHLLDPKTLEENEEARLLGRRLGRQGPMTRSQYQQSLHNDTLSLLNPEKEEDLLEQIILSRRAARARTNTTIHYSAAGSSNSWNQGAAGLGADGPQCVVCHSAPRTILVWPCRCLSLCEDCRISLAMNNFGNCVCCRRDVVAFSRLYVP